MASKSARYLIEQENSYSLDRSAESDLSFDYSEILQFQRDLFGGGEASIEQD